MTGSTPANPGGPPGAIASDQSMEDILASIRRILNEDEAPAAAPTPDALPAAVPPTAYAAPSVAEPAAPPVSAAAPPVAAPMAPEPLVLTEEMMVAAPEDTKPAPAAAEPPQSAVPEPVPLPVMAPAADSLLAPAAAAAATAAVGQLLRAVSSERGATVTRGGPSIEDVVREELRPLLKDWLDQHLPPLVERLVRAEIERVVGRALS